MYETFRPTSTLSNSQKGTGKVCKGPSQLRKRCQCGSQQAAYGEDMTEEQRNMIKAFPSVGKCDSSTNGGCEHNCDVTSVGQERCSCNPGYVLAADGKACNGTRRKFCLVLWLPMPAVWRERHSMSAYVAIKNISTIGAYPPKQNRSA